MLLNTFNSYKMNEAAVKIYVDPKTNLPWTEGQKLAILFFIFSVVSFSYLNFGFFLHNFSNCSSTTLRKLN